MSRRDYLYSEIAYVMNEIINKVEKDTGVKVPFERFSQSVDWRMDRGAEKYNQMIVFFKDQGYSFGYVPLVGDSDDWTQALVGHYLEKEIVPVVMGEGETIDGLLWKDQFTWG